MTDNPTMASALVGGGLGAGAGGLHAAWTNRNRDPSERRSILGSALTGGLAGGAIGGGLGLARYGLDKLKTQPQGLQHGDALAPGEFTHPDTGQRMRIDPTALKRDPGLFHRLRDLNRPQSPVDRSAQAVAGGIAATASRAVPGLRDALEGLGVTEGNTLVESQLPFSSWLLPKVGLLDAALHAPGLNLGERIGVGRIRPQFSRAKDDLLRGVKDFGEGLGIKEKLRESIQSDAKPSGNIHTPSGRPDVGVGTQLGEKSLAATTKKTGLGRTLQRLFGSTTAGGADPVLSVTHTPMVEKTIRDHVNPAAPNEGFIERKVQEPGQSKTETLTRQQAQQAKRLGYIANEKDLGAKSPRGLFRAGPGQFRMPGAKGALLGRLFGYGMVPLGEFALGGHQDKLKSDDELRQLIAQHAKPIG